LYRSVFCTAEAKGYCDKFSERHSTTLRFYVRICTITNLTVALLA